MSVIVAQIGARRHYAVPRALHRLGRLERLVTDLHAEQPLLRLLDAAVPMPARPRRLTSVLARRVGLPAARITSLTSFALSPWQGRRGGEALTDYWARRNGDFCREAARRGFDGARAVYAFNGAALEIFEAAKKLGLATVLDQTAAPWRWNARMLREEVERWPGWEDAPGELDASGLLTEREEREWDLADAVVCGSAFAAVALSESGGPEKRCTVVAHAGDDTLPTADATSRSRRSGPLRVLFAGTLQLRKGVQYLHAAAQLLKGEGVEIRLVGPSLLGARAMGAIARHAEITGPVARTAIDQHYAWADVLVLPTLSEGSANVCAEAVARGLPVITTPNAGSAVEHGCTGLIVPVHDAQSLASAIASLAQDPALREELADNCLRSRGGFAFESYATALERAITQPEGAC